MPELRTMGAAGDTRLIWDASSDDEVKNAKRSFADLVKKGYLAFSVKRDGDKGEQIKEFDAEAEKIILAPPMQGG